MCSVGFTSNLAILTFFLGHAPSCHWLFCDHSLARATHVQGIFPPSLIPYFALLYLFTSLSRQIRSIFFSGSGRRCVVSPEDVFFYSPFNAVDASLKIFLRELDCCFECLSFNGNWRRRVQLVFCVPMLCVPALEVSLWLWSYSVWFSNLCIQLIVWSLGPIKFINDLWVFL